MIAAFFSPPIIRLSAKEANSVASHTHTVWNKWIWSGKTIKRNYSFKMENENGYGSGRFKASTSFHRNYDILAVCINMNIRSFVGFVHASLIHSPEPHKHTYT